MTGCIIGGAIGDAFGGAYEGQPPSVEISDARQWKLSDDTQLTLATCEAITQSGGIVEPSVIAARFADWHRQACISGMGASTLKALSELVHGGHWALVGRKGDRAAGNGAAMRIAPLAFCLDPGDAKGRQTIRDVSRITHHHEEAYAGALAVAVAVRAAWDGTWDGERSLMGIVIEALPDTQVRDRMIELRQAGETLALPETGRRFGCSGYVVDSVPFAICGAQRVLNLGFRQMMCELIVAGGDTDTNASIAGQIAGTLLGRDALPEGMVGRLPEREFIERVARDFAQTVI
ncbi:MAG TPA: ADP-ribosylglycohydrolase family protein [Blastocatellia bacterium]|nr:ADP-ribosylglycohydrolase family protein [Blastocatellia bacterium]